MPKREGFHFKLIPLLYTPLLTSFWILNLFLLHSPVLLPVNNLSSCSHRLFFQETTLNGSPDQWFLSFREQKELSEELFQVHPPCLPQDSDLLPSHPLLFEIIISSGTVTDDSVSSPSSEQGKRKKAGNPVVASRAHTEEMLDLNLSFPATVLSWQY